MTFGVHDLPFLIVHGAVVGKLLLAGSIVLVTVLMRVLRQIVVVRRARTARAAAAAAVPWMRWIAMVVVAGLASGIGWKIETALGESWLRACVATKPPLHSGAPPPFEDAPVDTRACELAAAMPGSRDDAMQAMLDSIDRHPYRDEATVRRIYALSELVEGCSELSGRLLRDARYEDAAAVAHRCGDRRTEHLALRYAGKFDEAIAVAVPEEQVEDRRLIALPDPEEWILANHWNEAAAAAAARAAALAAGPHEPGEQRAVDMTALHYRCVAELFRYHGGDPGAAGRLRALAGGDHGGVCVPALSEITTGEQRRALLAQQQDDVLTETQILLDQLRWAEGLPGEDAGSVEHVRAEVILADPDTAIAKVGPLARLWLAGIAPPDSTPSLSRLRWSTVGQVLAGDLDRAAATAKAAVAAYAAARDAAAVDAELQKVDAELQDLKRDHRKLTPRRLAELEAQIAALKQRRVAALFEYANAGYVSHLPALVALHTPQAPIPVDLPADDLDRSTSLTFLLGPVWLRNGDSQREFTQSPRVEPSLKAAAAGDGLALAGLARATGFDEWTDAQVMAVLPRIKTHRDVVLRQLVWSSSPSHPFEGNTVFPWHLAIHAATRRDMFRLAGANDMAARWDAIFRRYDLALRDHRRLIALLLWKL